MSQADMEFSISSIMYTILENPFSLSAHLGIEFDKRDKITKIYIWESSKKYHYGHPHTVSVNLIKPESIDEYIRQLKKIMREPAERLGIQNFDKTIEEHFESLFESYKRELNEKPLKKILFGGKK